MIKIIISLISLLLSVTVMSQDVTVAEMRSWQEYCINKNDIVKKKMDAAFHGKMIESAPGSIKYFFYVINAPIEGQVNHNENNERDYCLNALVSIIPDKY